MIQHPGRILRDRYLAPWRITTKEAAGWLGVTPATVSRLLNEHCDLTADMAVRLSRVFGDSPEWWMARMAEVQVSRAKKRVPRLDRFVK